MMSFSIDSGGGFQHSDPGVDQVATPHLQEPERHLNLNLIALAVQVLD